MRVLLSLWRNRPLLVELVRRDIRSRFAGARFGLLWSLINPVVQLVSYGVIFGYVYASNRTSDSGAFVASLFCGLWPWWAFQEGTMRGLGAIVEQAGLLKKVPLRAEVCVLAAVTASFLLQMLGFVIFVVVFHLLGLAPFSARWLALPAIMLLGLGLSTGLGLVLAPIYLVVRDTLHVMNAVFTVWFFASPVLYGIEALPERLRPLAAINPMVGLIGLYRFAVLGSQPPSAAAILVTVATVLAGWMAGSVLFSRLEGVLDEYW